MYTLEEKFQIEYEYRREFYDTLICGICGCNCFIEWARLYKQPVWGLVSHCCSAACYLPDDYKKLNRIE